jgi:hypothetical protein
MNEQHSRLLARGGDAIARRAPEEAMLSFITGESRRLKRELCALLWERNGFYAFESALLVRPFDRFRQPLGVLQWNRREAWKACYTIDLGEYVFFAEDVFGAQFCIGGDRIHSFDPETGEFTPIADRIEDWAAWIIEDPDLQTGMPLAREWQAAKGAFQPGLRLLPKVPFVCGGEFSVDNLYAATEVDGMRFRASIANQIAGAPDGSKISLDIAGK